MVILVLKIGKYYINSSIPNYQYLKINCFEKWYECTFSLTFVTEGHLPTICSLSYTEMPLGGNVPSYLLLTVSY